MSTVNVTLRQINGLSFAGCANTKHWVVMDAPEDLGGSAAGSRPMEVVLMGIAGCAAMDVIAILKKKKVNMHQFRVEVEAEKADTHPQLYTKINFHYFITGENIREADVQRSIDLTDEKYCGAIAMIRPNVEVTHSFSIDNTGVFTTKTQIHEE